SRPEWKINGFRALMRQDFPQELYRQRVQVESIFSAIKRKLSDRAPGRSLLTQRLQALLLGLTFNLYRLELLAFHQGCQESYIPVCGFTGLSSPVRIWNWRLE